MSCADALGVVFASGETINLAWVPINGHLPMSPRNILISMLMWLNLGDLQPVQESTFMAPACVERTLVAASTSVTEPRQ